MSELAAIADTHRRLAILRGLAASPASTSNDSLLNALLDDLGVLSTRDQVRTAIAWLAEQGLVTVRDREGLVIVEATGRGLDVAASKAYVPGIARPGRR